MVAPTPPSKLIVQIVEFGVFLIRTHVKKKHLPPHPNIVDLKCMFADSVPYLPQAMSLYPDALPRRLNRSGAGRNMTLFLVMKRLVLILENLVSDFRSLASVGHFWGLESETSVSRSEIHWQANLERSTESEPCFCTLHFLDTTVAWKTTSRLTTHHPGRACFFWHNCLKA